MEACMTDVNVTELRQNLPAYLDKARKGQRIRITSRGKVIAEILPPAATADESRAARDLLKGSVLRFDRPLAPAIDPAEWETSR
jgi:prevent-host-death family protein